MLYVLDKAKVETTGDLSRLNSLANSLFFGSGLVMFQGVSSALVQFWESKGMLSPHLATVSPGAPWPKPRVEAATPQPRTVKVASPRDELFLNVQVVVSIVLGRRGTRSNLCQPRKHSPRLLLYTRASARYPKIFSLPAFEL